MNSRLRLLLAGAFAFVAVASASPAIAQAKPQDNKQTKQAKKQLDMAEAGLVDADKAKALFQEALDSANVAIQAKADNPLPHLLAGRALTGLKRYQEADAALDKALELRKEYAEEIEPIREGAWFASYQDAQPLLESGDYTKAAEVLEGANAMYTARPEIMVVLGQIYAQENQPDKAIERLKQADEVIKTRSSAVDTSMARQWKEMGADIPVTIAQAYISAKRYTEAAAALEGLVAANPDNMLYATNLASIYVQSQKPDEAKGVYAKLLSRPDLTPNDMYMIGAGYYDLEDYRAAADVFKKTTQTAVKDRDAYEMWARSVVLSSTKGGGTATPAQLQELVDATTGWTALDPNSRVGLTLLTKALNDLDQAAKGNEIFAKLNDLTVTVGDLQLRREATGATVTGTLENMKADQGKPVNVTVTFYDKAGTALGEKSVTVLTGAKPASPADQPGHTPINVTFQTDKKVDGFSYTVTTM